MVRPVRFVCHVREEHGRWTGEHRGPDIGPIRVSAPTRDEVLRKLESVRVFRAFGGGRLD